MFCTQCGKRVLDTMLFCPFCGASIVIPEQDESADEVGDTSGFASSGARPLAPSDETPSNTPSEHEAETAWQPDTKRSGEPMPRSSRLAQELKPSDKVRTGAEASASSLSTDSYENWRYATPDGGAHHISSPEIHTVPGKAVAPVVPTDEAYDRYHPASLFDDKPRVVEAISPTIRYSRTAGAQRTSPRRNSPAVRSPAGDVPFPVKVGPAVRDLAEGKAHTTDAGPARRDELQHRRSYIPVRDVNVDDMFMDASHPGSGAGVNDGIDDDFEADRCDFEEPERGSFFQRHIRGMVGLMLMLVLLVILLIWACLPTGQRTLAALNLAWSAEAYNELGHEAYEAGQSAQAAVYFDRAIALDEENYEYAQNAMVAHYEAGDADAAFELLKRCIRLRPDDAAVYEQLLILYPDPAARPWEASELLREGYERTGDEALNVSSE